MLDFETELSRAATLARAAGAAAMRFYGTASVVDKADASPVTEADRASNRVIVAGLREGFPGDAILSEESRDSAERLSAERVWIVDPLDGTKEFLAQNGEFSVMIGLARAGEPVLGVVYLPAVDVLFSAFAGGGAWVEAGEPPAAQAGSLPGGPSSASARRRLVRGPADAAALRLVGSRSHHDPLLEEMQRALGITDVEPCGSVGVKCTRIAEGRRDLYIHPVGYLKEWDTCAPEVVLREAGGWVSDCRGDRLRYNKRDTRQAHGIIAAAPGVAERVLAAVRPVYERAAA